MVQDSYQLTLVPISTYANAFYTTNIQINLRKNTKGFLCKYGKDKHGIGENHICHLDEKPDWIYLFKN